MSSRLTDEQLAIAQAKHMANTMDLLMDAMGVPNASLLRPKPVPAPTRDASLKWCPFPLNDSGWVINLGYTVDASYPDDPWVEVESYILQTHGGPDRPMTTHDFDSSTLDAMNEWCLGEYLKAQP